MREALLESTQVWTPTRSSTAQSLTISNQKQRTKAVIGSCAVGVAVCLFGLAPIASAQRPVSHAQVVSSEAAGLASPPDKKAQREAKKAEREAKKQERAEARAAKKDKAHKASHDDLEDVDNRTAAKSKSKSSAKEASIDLGGNDPLEGL